MEKNRQKWKCVINGGPINSNATIIQYAHSFFLLPVNDQHGEQGGHDNKPKPQENVGFLVDDILRQHAHGVVPADSSGSTVLVESALGDARKDINHRIVALLLVGVNKRELYKQNK